MGQALRIASDSCLSSLESVSLFLSLLFIFVGLFGDDVDGSDNFRPDADTIVCSSTSFSLFSVTRGIAASEQRNRKADNNGLEIKEGTLSQIQNDTISAAKAALNPVRINIFPQKQKQKKKDKGYSCQPVVGNISFICQEYFRPKEPELETSQRVRSVKIKSYAELEEEMMAKIPKFKARPINKKLVLDSHRWVPLPGVGFSASSFGDENHEDVTPPSNLVEHPPLVVFVNEELCDFSPKVEVYIDGIQVGTAQNQQKKMAQKLA